jgi:hypothetical protein
LLITNELYNIKDKIKIIFNDTYRNINELKNNIIKSINTNWISILIEGIILNKNYLNNFLTDLSINTNKKIDGIIYNYYINDSIIIPNKNLDNISSIYIFNKKIIKDYKYLLYYLNIVSDNGDFIYNIINKKYNIILSLYVNYFYNNEISNIKDKEINKKSFITFHCNNSFIDIFLNSIYLLNYNYNIFFNDSQYTKNVLDNIYKIPINNNLNKSYININIYNDLLENDLLKNDLLNNNFSNNYHINFNDIYNDINEKYDFSIFHKNYFNIKSNLNKDFINNSYKILLNYINPLKKTILFRQMSKHSLFVCLFLSNLFLLNL